MGSDLGHIIIVRVFEGLHQCHFGKVPEKNLALTSDGQNGVDFGDRKKFRVGIEGLDRFIGCYIEKF
jgi:hypothetical protein